jgi:hypothetical protein
MISATIAVPPADLHMPITLREKLETVPARPGGYLFKDRGGDVVYVGKARSLRDRVRSYFQAGRPVDPRKGSMIEEIQDLDLVVTDSEMEALALENNLIKRPRSRGGCRARAGFRGSSRRSAALARVVLILECE